MSIHASSANLATGPIRVGHVGLAEAGNLGDDLILLAVLRTISSALPRSCVRFVSHGISLNWAEIWERLALDISIEPAYVGRGVAQTARAPRLLADCSAIVFGGGGLLQTTHHPMRPYQWLRFLGVGRHHAPAIAVGLGLGPLNEDWMKILSEGPKYFEQCWLRDIASHRLAAGWGWDAGLCSDFVDADFLESLGLAPKNDRTSETLGVSLRAWPGLDVVRLADHIDTVAAREGVDRIEFFVLESKNGEGLDVDFTYSVSRRVQLPSSVAVYDSRNLLNIMERMMGCSAAIAMKLHAAAIWGHAGTPVYPIIYAPKVAAHFGFPYRGLEILDEPVPAIVADESELVPTASQVLSEWLQSGIPDSASVSAMKWRSHIINGAKSDAHQLGMMLKRIMRYLQPARGKCQ